MMIKVKMTLQKKQEVLFIPAAGAIPRKKNKKKARKDGNEVLHYRKKTERFQGGEGQNAHRPLEYCRGGSKAWGHKDRTGGGTNPARWKKRVKKNPGKID